MKSTDYTLDAQESLGRFVEKAGKHFLTVRTPNVYEQPVSLRITPKDLAEFYATQMGSSIGTLAGHHGESRAIGELAFLAMGWFQNVNLEGIRRAARKVGLEPKF